jgi:hypothetical protein
MLSRLFRRLFLTALAEAFAKDELQFLNELAHLNDNKTFARHLARARSIEWVVYSKPPFGGPDQVLAYLGRYTHRVAIANSRIVHADGDHVAFRWKDYRGNSRDREKIMRLHPHEFIRRFLLHVLPDGFHRMRHFGFVANCQPGDRISLCRSLLAQPSPTSEQSNSTKPQQAYSQECPDCRYPMRRSSITIARAASTTILPVRYILMPDNMPLRIPRPFSASSASDIARPQPAQSAADPFQGRCKVSKVLGKPLGNPLQSTAAGSASPATRQGRVASAFISGELAFNSHITASNNPRLSSIRLK